MRRFLNLAFVAVLIGCAGCTGAAATAPTTTASAARQPGQDVGTALDAALPSHILELPFTASDGRTVRLQDFAGKVVAVSDVMTLCQETCPMDTATFVDTDRAEQTAGLGGDEIFLSITVDPGRDTRAQLAAYRDLFAPPQNWLALTGPPTSVDALWNYLGVWRERVGEPKGTPPHNWRTGRPLNYDVAHSDEVFFVDRRGHERFVLEGPPYATAGSVPKALRSFMDPEGRTNLASPSSTAWTRAQAQQVLRWLG